MSDHDDQIRKRQAGRLRAAIADLQAALSVVESAPALSPVPSIGGRPCWMERIDEIHAAASRCAAQVINARTTLPAESDAARMGRATASFD